jgi:hypothetical protein
LNFLLIRACMFFGPGNHACQKAKLHEFLIRVCVCVLRYSIPTGKTRKAGRRTMRWLRGPLGTTCLFAPRTSSPSSCQPGTTSSTTFSLG